MRGWLVLIAVLASLPTPNQSAGTDANPRDASKDAGAVRHMENSLLSMFGMTRRPKVDRTKVVIPQAMRDLYNTITGLDLGALALPKAGIHTKTANTVRSFTHSESDIDKRFPGRHRFRLSFNVSSIPKGEILKAAELTLNRKKLEDHEGPRHQQVLVYDLVRPGVKGKRDPILVLVDSKKVDVRKSGSVSLDVLPAVERWLANPKNNHGLVVHIAGPRQHQALGHHVRLRRSVDEDRARWQPKQPLLFTYTDDGKAKHRTGDAMMQNRARRASAKRMHRRKDGSENCKRRSLYVDFADVGWNDWIVAPPGYDAYYCHGDCPFPMADHLNSTNHAIVQTLVNSVNPAAVPKACCVPTQLSPISMLYLDEENKVVLKNYQDMAVLGCGCR